MNCYNCKKLVGDSYIEVRHVSSDRDELVSVLHDDCYNTAVQYLQKAREEWDAQHQVPAHRSSRISGQAPTART